MSSQDEPEQTRPENDGQPAEKRRRVRACDMCRRRKVKCDGGRVSGDQCTNCVTYKCPCTYTQSDKKRFTDPEYVQNLEKQLAQTHELLARLTAARDAAENSIGSSPPSSAHEQNMNALDGSSLTCPARGTALNPEDIESSDDEGGTQSLNAALKRLNLEGFSPPNFVGKSSDLALVQTALDVKQDYSGQAGPGATVEDLFFPDNSDIPWLEGKFATREEEIFPPESYPEPSMMWSFVELYFSYCNVFAPLLHRAMFEKSIKEGLHLVDAGFASTLMLVCAIGAKFSDDPRVLPDANHSTSAGWNYFSRVQDTRRSIKLGRPTLYDVQIPCLIAVFLLGGPCPQVCSRIIAHGIRVAQDLGIHRRKCYKDVTVAEGELRKRAFWILLTIDRAICQGLGISCCIQEEDYDLDLPLDVDDEYWFTGDPQLDFKQPPGKPSTISFFISSLKLNSILARALRTIYAINKSKALLGYTGPQWEEHMVAELDSLLNQWIDTVPDHLRWNPNMKDPTFFKQSAYLYSLYFQIQIIVHRQWIPSPKKSSSLSLASLAICTNAARSSIHILEAQHERFPHASYQSMLQLFSIGVVLIINIWGGKRSGMSSNPAKEMQDVYKCMRILKNLEQRWFVAGRILGVMTQLVTVGDLPLPTPSPQPRQKRSRDGHLATPDAQLNGGTTAQPLPNQRPIAGSSRVQHSQHSSRTWSPNQDVTQNGYTLPVHSDELSRLPVHPVFDSDGTVPVMRPTWPPSTSAPPNRSLNANSIVESPYPYPQAHNYSDTRPELSTFSPITSSATISTNQYGYSVNGQWPNDVDLLGSASDLGPSLDSHTLALLSTAPNCMEWNDWGTYINHFGGFGGLHNSEDAHDGMPSL
ncbi:fungal-specific transcription factor domain-containing protein [Irpex rosettiformis]|uniref:Fungal-specific transcription factor domain-containing protein n=1 Tax=Irpex rosettiformis TaxID=378272 RepID=A0ACB8U9Q3_9APHY|nr:fungal-specific transcription factor domain-containing protein [Irpex rosettiformis]